MSSVTLTTVPRRGILAFVASTDHKSLGARLFVMAFGFFGLAGVLALVMRTELATPQLTIVSPESDAFVSGTIEELGIKEDQRVRDLAIMLNPYAKGGQYERFFSGPNTIDFNNDFIVIENEELKRKPDLHAVVNILLLIAGNVMEPSSIVLIMAPILFPVAVKLGIHPVHLGILMVVNMEVGMCHPPVGLNLYVASGITKMGISELTVAVSATRCSSSAGMPPRA